MNKWVKRLLIAVIAFEAIYLGVAFLLFNTPIGPKVVNLKPEKVNIEWDGGHSWIPGKIHVEGLRFRSQTPRLQWYLTVDQGSAWINLPALAFKRFYASAIEAEGGAFYLRRRLAEGETLSPDRATPEIPGLKNPPDRPPESLYKTPKYPWHIRLTDIEARGVREIWVEDFRIPIDSGSASVGSFTIRTQGGAAALDDGRVELPAAEVRIGDRVLASGLRVAAEPSLEPFVARGAKFSEIATKLSGPMEVSGELTSLGLLNLILQDLPLSFGSEGSLTLDAKIDVAKGMLTDGSRFEINADALDVDYLKYRVGGDGTISGSVTAESGTPITEIDVALNEIAMAYGKNPPHLKDNGFQVTAKATALSLAGQSESIDVIATLPEASLDLKHYNNFLPDASGVDIQSGTGFIESRFEFSTPSRELSGDVKLRTDGLAVRVGEVSVTGRMTMTTTLREGDLDTMRFDARGTEFALEEVSVATAEETLYDDWWGKILLGVTRLDLGDDSLRLEGDVTVELRDSRPIIAIAGEASDMPKWLNQVFTVENVVSDARINVSDNLVRINDFAFESDKITLLADAELQKGRRAGLVFARYGKLTAAVESSGEDRDWKLINSREWFDKKRAERGRAGKAPEKADQ